MVGTGTASSPCASVRFAGDCNAIVVAVGAAGTSTICEVKRNAPATAQTTSAEIAYTSHNLFCGTLTVALTPIVPDAAVVALKIW